MAIWINILWVLLSVVAIIFTADIALRSSLAIAKKFKISDALIGMTILSIGTSLPEIMTHIIGSINILRHPELIHDLSGLVIGANIGSDIFQQNFLIGLIGIIGVILVHRKRLINDVGGLIAAAVLLLIFSANGVLSRLEGFILVALYIAYLFILKKYDLLEDEGEEIVEVEKNHVLKNSIYVITSFIIMAFAAHLLLENSEILVQATPLSASFFGVIILGIASAFPEMTTSLMAVFRKKAKISAGVLIGSNITNPMFAAGLGALISTYTIPRVSIVYDLPFKIVTAFFIFWMLRDGKLKKKEAVILVVLYIVYLIVRNIYFPVDVFTI